MSLELECLHPLLKDLSRSPKDKNSTVSNDCSGQGTLLWPSGYKESGVGKNHEQNTLQGRKVERDFFLRRACRVTKGER